MRILFINDIEVGKIEIIGGDDFSLEGKLFPNEQFEKYKNLFKQAASDLVGEELLAETAQDEIESTLRITVLNSDDHTRQDVYLFVNGDHCTWREEYIDSKYKYIYFYRVKDKYGEFSNFYPPSDDVDKTENFRLFIKGKSWKTTEHFYQAMKFEGLPQEDEVRNAKNAYWAAKLGNKLSPIREDWNKVKDNVMYEAVFAKFNQNEDLKELL